jgi:hypothetical protein
LINGLVWLLALKWLFGLVTPNLVWLTNPIGALWVVIVFRRFLYDNTQINGPSMRGNVYCHRPDNLKVLKPQPSITPNYSEQSSGAILLKKAATEFLEDSRSLSLISMVTDSPRNFKELPFWIPNFSVPASREIWRVPSGKLDPSKSESRASLGFQIDGQMLPLKTSKLGKIVALGKTLLRLFSMVILKNFGNLYCKWTQFTDSLAVMAATRKYRMPWI